MIEEDISIEPEVESFIEDNQRHFFGLLFSAADGEWDEAVGNYPNKKIIIRLDSGNPNNIYELFSILERKIKIWEVNSKTKKDALSLKLSIASYKNKIGTDPGYDAIPGRIDQAEVLSTPIIEASPTIVSVSGSPEVNFDMDKSPSSSCLTRLVNNLSSFIGLGGNSVDCR